MRVASKQQRHAYLRQKLDLFLGEGVYKGGDGPPERIENPAFQSHILLECSEALTVQAKSIAASVLVCMHVHVASPKPVDACSEGILDSPKTHNCMLASDKQKQDN